MQFLTFSLLLIGCFAIQQTNAGFVAGKCFDSPVLANFDATKYLGLWYEIERFNYIFEQDLKCVRATYGRLNDTAVSVYNTGVNINSGKFSEVKGYAYVPNAQEPNKLLVRLPVTLANFTIIENTGTYNVWETDYTTYAVVYSCSQVIPNLLKLEVVWILSRTDSLNPQLVAQIKDRLKQKNINLNDFELVDQSCPK